MAGKIDEISSAIGEIKEAVRSLARLRAEDCERQERESDRLKEALKERDQLWDARHVENQAQIASVKVMIGELSSKLDTHTISISGMQPQIIDLQGAKKRLAGYAAVGLAVLWAGGFAVEAVIKALFTWIVAKFGG